MTRLLDADVFASAKAALPVPYNGGVGGDTIAIVDGTLAVTASHRHPTLLLCLRRPLVDERLVVSIVVGEQRHPDVVFGAYSHEGTALPAVAPTTTADLSGPFSVHVTVRYQGGDAAFSGTSPEEPALQSPDVEELLEGRLVTGVLGKLAVIGALEKQRLIAQAREVAASRSLDLARRHSLDVLGVELGVPRRTDIDEADDAYRARLAIFRAFRLSTPGGFANALNGPGDPEGANRGLPALAGVKHRFDIIEQINPLSVALKLVEVGDGSSLNDFHKKLRRNHLVDLLHRAPTQLPPARRVEWEADRATIRSEVIVPAGDSARYLHPGAARCLASAVRLMRGVGISDQISLNKAHDPQAGSEFELGLGIVAGKLTQEQLKTLVERIPEVARSERVEDPNVALAADMHPRPVEDDPLGAWFFNACGFVTVVEHSTKEVLLSPFPMHGLSIEGPGRLDPGDSVRLRARYVSASSGGVHVLAAQARQRVEGAFAVGEQLRLMSIVDGAQLTEIVESIAGDAPDAPVAFAPLVKAGIVARDSAAQATSLLGAADLDLAVAFLWKREEVVGTRGDDSLVKHVSELSRVLTDGGFSSVVGLSSASSDSLVLVASVAQLPGSLSVPGEPPAAAYWWTETAIISGPHSVQRHPCGISADGSTSVRVRARAEGIGLVAVVGYHRVGLADPYGVRITLADPEALLTAEQYGYVMNLLGAFCPIGIEINTFDLRRAHVDADGDGESEWLTSRASRSYHQYRQVRWSRRSADRTP
ncbi:hypothetical protein I6E74_02980 [Salinibacterium sp. SWN139]|uniref:hypothetical protein n=1 Tax=Salinibacterium sp. SWN139 TaxID=2792055 RepID=UPI0018CE6DE0|nr:hypothetical protein [Salinibacterium sp. SWN139]MBH0053133.1 hypothetical protein [Salinibacterium sp. SWN139]